MDLLKSALFLVSVAAAACVPELEDRGSLIDAPRVLAVRAEPAEAKPGASVRWDALVAGPDGDGAQPLAATLDWALCSDAVPLDRIEPVSPRCLAASADWLLPIGTGPSVSGAIPADACRRFGPTPPDPLPGQPSPRPVDPDRTGGYYQPLRALVPSLTGAAPDYVTVRTRVTCGVAGASMEVAAELARRARPNLNPAVARLARVDGGRDEELADGAAVPPGTNLRLRAALTECGADEPCDRSERYAMLDPASRTVAERREGLRFSWLATAGRFGDERTAIAADDPAAATTSENEWRTPDSDGEVRLWIVVRDDRGGAGWRGYRLHIAQ